ncbi:membrane related protein CP5 [Hibiscus trionum]|uniref:Membrane related protein CP5 n=1 Tax=Hibiscus trionum TaxID=183268 RepID=A0A9W7JM65_HIBTR|nr:membrane related protein CP5 [Hibiscus trionum]
MALVSVFLEILRKPTIGDVLSELMFFIAPLCGAVIVGVLVGWAWKPKWANIGREILIDSSGSKDSAPAPSDSSSSSFGFISSLNSIKSQFPSCNSWISDDGAQKGSFALPPTLDSNSSSSQIPKGRTSFVTNEDLEHLCNLVEEKDGGPAWIHMMNCSTKTMYYQAWQRDLEAGPTEYRSRTVFEDATPEMVRDFFWDDQFRPKWDKMLASVATMEECPTTGIMVVHWLRKFPFFCSDREYVIGRRIWESGRSYYCVTKGVPYASIPRKNTPRRVDLYYSSWCIRAVESRKGDGQLTACEVLLFHHEDMGIPWKIAKLGVRQGMWGTVNKIDPGLRAYQKERASGALSHCAFMAQINTKVSADYLRSFESKSNDSSELETHSSSEKPSVNNIPKLLVVVGGVIALACSLDQGLLTKAAILGVARKFSNIGKRL